MPVHKKYLEKLYPNKSFHVYNRTNNKEDLFKEEINRFHFLQNLNFYLKDYVDIHVYCLMSNHFHLLITTKSISAVRLKLKTYPNSSKLEIHKAFLSIENVEEIDEIYNKLIVNQFRRFFLSYTKGINRMYKRDGNLFNRPFKRIAVNDLGYLMKLVLYIHKNPDKHGLLEGFQEYQWSSFQSYIGQEDIIPLKKKKILDLFKTSSHFLDLHHSLNDYSDIQEFLLEESG
jgi:REP element-mobilizing transposase RayT